jgi:putative flippase GtrA
MNKREFIKNVGLAGMVVPMLSFPLTLKAIEKIKSAVASYNEGAITSYILLPAGF